MNYKISFIFYLILTSCVLHGSKISKAFEALSIYDYFKAKKLFYSQLTNCHKTASAYGLSIIYYRNDNPFSNQDSASKYITLAGNYYKKSPVQESYFGFNMDSCSILHLADSIAQKGINKAFKINRLEEIEYFVANNPFAPLKYKQAALQKRDYLCYHANLYYNSSDSTRTLLLRYPESCYQAELHQLLDKQLFEDYTAQKDVQSYINFIKNFEANRFVALAQDELFDVYRKSNDVQGLEFFVHSYPKSRSCNEAWKLLYALTVKSYNNEELKGFIKAYPEFPFKESINKEVELNNRLLLPINDSDYVGFIDSSGSFFIPPVFDAATPFKEGLAVVTKNDTAFFINKENHNIFNTFYTEAFPFCNGIAPVNKNGQWHLINRQGQEIAGPFDDLSEQSELAYTIKINNKYGAIDVYGNYLIQPKYDYLGDFKNGKAYYLSNGLYGFVNKNGIASQARFQWISDFDENNIAIVKKNNQYGLINGNDSLFLNAHYDLILKADNSNFILVRNNKYGFYSSKNCFITDIDNDFKKELSVNYYTNGKLFKLIKNKKQAIMDANGKTGIDFGIFDEVGFAQNNLIKVKRKNKVGFTDKKLNVIIPFKYTDASDFSDSLSIGKTKKGQVIINTKGVEIYHSTGQITTVNGNYFIVEEENGNTLIDKTGLLLYSGIEYYKIIANTHYDNSGEYLFLKFENNSKKLIKL